MDDHKPGQSLNDLIKGKAFSISSGKLISDSNNPSHQVDESDPSHLDSARSLPVGHPARKATLLTVGANSYIRENLPADVMRDYDTHLVFHPNSKPEWRVGAV